MAEVPHVSFDSRPQKFGSSVEAFLLAERYGAGKSQIFPHQWEAAFETIKFLEPNHKDLALIVAPTGAGKTGIIAFLIYMMKRKTAMVLTPSITISNHIKDSIAFPLNRSTFLEKVKFFKHDETEESKNNFLLRAAMVRSTEDIDATDSDIIIINAQKLGANSNVSISKKEEDEWVKGKLRRFFSSVDFLVVDEAHHFPAPTWKSIIREFREHKPNGKMIFLTATPYRNVDGERKNILPPQFVAYEVQKTDLQAQVIRPVVFKELQAAHMKGNVLVQHMAESIFLTLDEQDNVEKRVHHQAMVLVRSVAIANRVSDIFNKVKPNSTVAIVGGHKSAGKATSSFIEGRAKVAVVCQMLIEGFDNSNVSICMVFRVLKSAILLEQFLGRCMRRFRFQESDAIPDQTTAVLMTYAEFGLAPLFNSIDNTVADNFFHDDLIEELSRGANERGNVEMQNDLEDVEMEFRLIQAEDIQEPYIRAMGKRGQGTTDGSQLKDLSPAKRTRKITSECQSGLNDYDCGSNDDSD